MAVALGSVCLVAIALLALVFCIRKHKRKEARAITFQRSISAGTNDSRFRFPYFFVLLSLTFFLLKFLNMRSYKCYVGSWIHVGPKYL